MLLFLDLQRLVLEAGHRESVRMPLYQSTADRNVRPTGVFHRRSLTFAGFGKKSRRKGLVVRAAVGAMAAIFCADFASPAKGALSYWDTNGTAVGAVNTAGTPANGIWGTNAFWNRESLPDLTVAARGLGATSGWTDGDTAVFSAGTNASGGLATGQNLITVAGNQTAAQITFEEGTNTLSGGIITLQGVGTAGIVQLSTPVAQTINSTIAGSSGLTVKLGPTTLAGSLTLGGVNTFSGPLTLATGRLNLNASGAASTGAIVFNPNTTISSTAIVNSVIDIANPITFNLGSGEDFSSNTGVTLSLTGKLSGAGNWTHGVANASQGTLILNNTTSDFTGGLTIQSGQVIVTGDHTLGNPGLASSLSTVGNTAINGSGQLAFQSVSGFTYSTAEQIIINTGATGPVQINNIAGNNTFAGGVQFNQGTMNTIGVDGGSLTLSGQVIAATSGSKPFSKVGAGTLIVSGENTSGFNSDVNVNNGTLRLTGTTATAGGLTSATALNINNGSLVVLDNSTVNNQDRIADAAAVNFNGGNLLLKGNGFAPTTETVDSISFGAGEDVLSTLTIAPGFAQPAALVAGSLTRNPGGMIVFRGPALGNFPPNQVEANIRFTNAPQMVGAGGGFTEKSIIVGALGDNSITGPGSDFVTYDPIGGVTPLTTLDYAPDFSESGIKLQNVGIGGAQTVSTNTTVNSLKIVDPKGSISIDPDTTLTINSGMILAGATSTDGISGPGKLAFASGMDGIVAGTGDLTINSDITTTAAFIKAGTGKLTLGGNNTLSTVYVSGGTLLPTVTAALGDNSSVHLGGGGTLELPDGMDLSNVDLYLHNGGRVLGRGNSSYSRDVQISDGASVILESPDQGGMLRFNQRFSNLGTGAIRPTIALKGPGTVSFAAPTSSFFGNYELRNGVTVPLEARNDMLGNPGNSVIFGTGGGTLLMHSFPGGTAWGNPVVVNGPATFQDESTNGNDVFGSLTVNGDQTIHHYLPTGLNFIDPKLTFGNTALFGSPTFNIDRPPIAGDYGRLTISNVREFNGPKTINKMGEGILTIAGSAGFTGDLNASQGIVIIPDSVPNISGITGEGIVVGSVNVKAGGHIDPGYNGVGILLVDGITINGTPTNKTQINMEGDATGFDKLFVFGQDKLHINGEATINLANLGGVTAGDYVLIDYLSTPISDEEFGRLSLASPIFNGANAALVHDPGTTQIRLHLEGPPPPQWNVDADGNWNNLANWDPATIPDGATASANFFGKITAPRTVTVDGARTLAQMNFSNANRYTIAGDSLTLGDGNHNAAINVNLGSHVISSLVGFNGNVQMNIVAGSALSLTGGLRIADNKTATMIGGGTLEIGGDQHHGDDSVLDVRSGKVIFNSNAGTPASDDAGYARLNIKVSGEGSSVVLNADQDVASIRVDFDGVGNQSLDLASPPVPGQFRSVRVYGGDLASAKASLWGAIRTANAAGAPNRLDGIYDSGLITHVGAQLGIAQLVDSHGDDYILMRPTRTGDLNLDGAVTISDFIDLASNFNQIGMTWQEGDLNYDGAVTISDFIDLASNFNATYAGSVGPISADDRQLLANFASSLGVDPSIIGSVVPEPGVMGILGGAMVLVGARRRRRA
jgi:fibronectin-binding autotransporter adhesin